MSLSKVDQSISVINFLIRKKKKRIAEIQRRADITESQKIYIGEELDFIRNVDTLIKSFRDSIDANLGKLPPQDLEIEQGILGAIMLERPDIIKKLRTYLHPDHFYSGAHKCIYRAMLDLGDKALDMRTVVDQLRKNGTIEQVGGPYYIAELTAKVSQSANIEHHSRILMEMAIRRQMIVISGETMEECYDHSKDVFMILERLEKSIKELNGWIK